MSLCINGLALRGERQPSNNNRANSHSQQESVHKPAAYSTPTAKKKIHKPDKNSNFEVDMGLNSEYNEGNLLEALSMRM
jgi:hypothetical protein